MWHPNWRYLSRRFFQRMSVITATCISALIRINVHFALLPQVLSKNMQEVNNCVILFKNSNSNQEFTSSKKICNYIFFRNCSSLSCIVCLKIIIITWFVIVFITTFVKFPISLKSIFFETEIIITGILTYSLYSRFHYHHYAMW